MPTQRLGNRIYVEVRPAITRRDAAFAMHRSEDYVANMLDRGVRLRAKGFSDEEIVERGALPVSMVGSRRGVSPSMLALTTRVADSPLALRAVGLCMEGRFRAPRAPSTKQLPPHLTEYLDLLV